MKRTAEIRQMIENLTELKDFLSVTHEFREAKFEDRSDKWKESDKGGKEAQVISDLEEAKDEAESLLEKMDELFPER